MKIIIGERDRKRLKLSKVVIISWKVSQKQ
jgi:hypothetical protein